MRIGCLIFGLGMSWGKAVIKDFFKNQLQWQNWRLKVEGTNWRRKKHNLHRFMIKEIGIWGPGWDGSGGRGKGMITAQGYQGNALLKSVFAWSPPPNRSKPHFMILVFWLWWWIKKADSLCLTTKGRDEALLSTETRIPQNLFPLHKIVPNLENCPQSRICLPASKNCPQYRKEKKRKNPIIALLRGSHGLSGRRAWRALSYS